MCNVRAASDLHKFQSSPTFSRMNNQFAESNLQLNSKVTGQFFNFIAIWKDQFITSSLQSIGKTMTRRICKKSNLQHHITHLNISMFGVYFDAFCQLYQCQAVHVVNGLMWHLSASNQLIYRVTSVPLLFEKHLNDEQCKPNAIGF